MRALGKIFIILLTSSIMSISTKAEYRAFLLQIKSPQEEARLVKSSLDPFQYIGYYPVRADESITYIDTWRCPGRTGGLQPICKSPKEIAREKDETVKADAATNKTARKPDETPTSKSLERKPANN